VLERKLDGLDCSFHPGAETARRREEDAPDHVAMVAAYRSAQSANATTGRINRQ